MEPVTVIHHQVGDNIDESKAEEVSRIFESLHEIPPEKVECIMCIVVHKANEGDEKAEVDTFILGDKDDIKAMSVTMLQSAVSSVKELQSAENGMAMDNKEKH